MMTTYILSTCNNMIFLLYRSDTSLIPNSNTSLIRNPNTSLVSLERRESHEALRSQDDLSLHCHNTPKTPPTRRVRSYINKLVNDLII